MQIPTGNERERLLAILDLWHKIEFFIPYDLSKRATEDENKRAFWLHAETLKDDGDAVRRPIVPEHKEITGLTLFLGVFSKSEISKVSRNFAGATNGTTDFEDAERGDLDGDTCFASLELDPQGNPIFTAFSISTLPWALGQVRKRGLAALSSEAFADGRQRLQELLGNFQAQRRLHHQKSEDTDDQPLTPAEILALHALLCDWAGFAPDADRPVALVEIRYRDKPSRPTAKLLPAPLQHNAAGDDDDEEDGTPEQEIGILNSFFIEDIEKAMGCVRSGTIPEPLRQYLTPLASDARIDLYTETGRRALIRSLHPRNLNAGRWLAEAHHAMSLMQQFAINTALETLSETGLFSVNGPPGTGKTTLLRDIFADNIVRRARVLAALRTARDAFDGASRKVNFKDGSTAWISSLNASLTGFEMVVASSNNAAVENISRDLPKQSSITKARSFGYLQTVAHKIAAQKDNGSFTALTDENRPWGLIACALGKSGNRRAFKERFAFMPAKEDKAKEDRAKPDWSGLDKPQTIWEWRDSYGGPTFAEAGERFRNADEAVRSMIDEYGQFADLYGEIALTSFDAFCALAREALETAETAVGLARDRYAAAEAETLAVRTELDRLGEEERLLDRSMPAWWKRMLPNSESQRHRDNVKSNAREQIALRKTLANCERDLAGRHRLSLEKALRHREQAERELHARQETWSEKSARFEELRQRLDGPALPANLDDLETDRFQIEGLWHSDRLAGLRSALLETALTLHEAWLAEVSRSSGGFGGNIVAITKLLSGNAPDDGADIPPVWQSLFIIVPVVSTTFASFARQFAGLGPASIGWVFVDEAGQAVPQAAVGALMRARRLMAIGDPLQIEPVFTLPGALIKALSRLSPYTSTESYSPNRVSVQTLADAANCYGTELPSEDGNGLWIGSPLRVHRRCIDPMFSLANRIAYRDKMVFGLKERWPADDAPPFYGDSVWIDVGGKVSGRQRVPEQIDFIVDVLVATYRRDGALPDLYVISPFKEIKNALKAALKKARWVNDIGSPRTSPPQLKKWLKDRVGTVHTFQGKERDTVFMILGADNEHAGAAAWASSKPNLLNVALTRAQRRFHIVADRRFWEAMPYFRDVAGALETVDAEEFLRSLQSSSPIQRAAR